MSGQSRESSGVVLSVGSIPDLLWLRAQVLYVAGYEVISCSRAEEADLRLRNSRYDTLLLCYSISDDWQKILIAHFREYCPEGRVVAISNVPFARMPEGADRIVYGIEGAEALLNAVSGKAA